MCPQTGSSETPNRPLLTDRGADARFDVQHDTSLPEALVVGFSAFGRGGLIAAEYLVDRLGLEETGRITAEGCRAIANDRMST